MCKVSVIIPIYNSAQTLKKCIDSILTQTDQDFEIVAVDDGSIDNSLTILKNYQKKWKDKIVVETHQHAGVAHARNHGIRLACGEFIMFVDSDDFLEPTYIETYRKEIETNQLDIVAGGYCRVTPEGKVFEKRFPSEYEWGKFSIITPWSKIFRKQFLIENKIEFLDYPIGEDIYFYLQTLNATDQIKTISYIGYNWFYNPASVSNTQLKGFQKEIDILFVIRNLKEKLDQSTRLSQITLNYFYLRLAIWYLFYSGRTATPNEFLEQYHYLNNYFSSFIPEYKSIIRKYIPKGEARGTAFLLKFFLLAQEFHLLPFISKIYCKGKEKR